MKPDRQPSPTTGSAVVPPLDLMNIVGSGSAESYLKVGQGLFEILRAHGGLRRSHRVLDVGCGCGRLALPLTDYLTKGSYDGFDVVPELIAWCRQNISSRHANFHFEHVDVANAFYQDRARGRAAKYRFPYESDTFDLAILASIFTHMLRDDLANYAAEVVRTLKPGGTAVMTFFLLNDESRRMEDRTKKEFRTWWRYQRGGIRVMDLRRPEAAVSYPEETARALLRENGLEVQQILLGSWCGRLRAVWGQDIIVARKPIAAPKRDTARSGGIVRRLKDWLGGR
jgi:SAM-dependent methyltransferase